jgi:hypothetical protein
VRTEEGRTQSPSPRPTYVMSWCTFGEERIITASVFLLWKENVPVIARARVCPFQLLNHSL